MLGASGFEVGREVLVGGSPFVRANDPDLLAAQALPQGLQNADFIVDALDTVPLGRAGMTALVPPERRAQIKQRGALSRYQHPGNLIPRLRQTRCQRRWDLRMKTRAA